MVIEVILLASSDLIIFLLLSFDVFEEEVFSESSLVRKTPVPKMKRATMPYKICLFFMILYCSSFTLFENKE